MGLLTHEWIKEEDPINLPEITDEELFRRADLFDLLHDNEDGTMYLVDLSPKDIKMLKNISCLWSPKDAKVSFSVIEKSLKPVPFYVCCGYHGFFKPSIYEVMSQIPLDELVEKGYNAFYIDNHIEILTSGLYQKANAFFSKIEKTV